MTDPTGTGPATTPHGAGAPDLTVLSDANLAGLYGDALKNALADARTALAALGHERNTWARQMADLRDEKDTAIAAAEQARADLGEMTGERDDLSFVFDQARADLTAAREALVRVRGLYSGDSDNNRHAYCIRPAALLAALSADEGRG